MALVELKLSIMGIGKYISRLGPTGLLNPFCHNGKTGK
jgi:hypothetical protein